jgi:hypothetical protein
MYKTIPNLIQVISLEAEINVQVCFKKSFTNLKAYINLFRGCTVF